MKTLFKNAYILEKPGLSEPFFGSLAIDEDKISYVGPSSQNESFYQHVIDCNGDLLMPGFKNAHTHSAMIAFRSMADDLPLKTWLEERIFPLEERLQKGDVYRLSKVAILEYLMGGTTACFDMYYSPLEMAEASREMGFRTVLLGTITSNKQSIEELASYYHEINAHQDDLVTYQLGYHAEYTADEELLRELSRLAHRLKAPVYCHCSETKSETEGSLLRHQLPPLAYMESLGLLDYGGGIFHGVYLEKEELKLLKKHRASVATCPGSNAKLASGIAPLLEILEEEIPLAIGTDGAASNNGLDMFYEMRLASVLQKLLRHDPSALKACEVLKAATLGGSYMMNLPFVSTLEKGQKADLIRIDLHKPDMQPLHNISDNLVYAGSKADVKMTMINGRILYEDGNFYVGEDINKIYREAQEVADRLLKK